MNKNYILYFLDCLSTGLALYLAFLLRFEFSIPPNFIDTLTQWAPYFILIQLVVFHVAGLYNRIWRYTSLFDLYAIISASATSFGISFFSIFFIMGHSTYPRSVLLMFFIINIISILGSRLSIRVYHTHYKRDTSIIAEKSFQRKKLLLLGAGTTGEKLAKDILSYNSKKYEVAGFLDDNSEKHGALIHGKKVFGSIVGLPNQHIEYDELLITAPSASGDQLRRIIKVCKESGKRYRTVPGTGELINREITMDRVRDVSYSDLLGRDEVKLDMNSLNKMLNGKRILITGAGGSIGSELVKQSLIFKPSEIICLDNNEEKIYNIDQKFSKISNVIIKTVLCSITKEKECKKVFIENRPHIVFHAAAYKHVPIQENHPWTAVNTNIGGTLNLILLCDKYNVEKFVLVSTDKAVNPVNIMGATKRAAEKLIQSYNFQTKTSMMAVRFGNVLGSSGSAIPTFQRQINDGGPITVTHPEMTRYFMSIQEASQLILQCGFYGKNGEIFLLEMGKPIKITQMVKDLIRLSGYEPNTDIPIVFTGLRPGEKLYEELQLLNEKKITTDHKKIMILKQKENPIPWDIIYQTSQSLIRAANRLDSESIKIILKQMLPTYSPQDFSIASKKKLDYINKYKA